MDLGLIKLWLFDIDGVFLAGKQAPRLVSGRRILPALRRRQLPFRLVTNTSTHSRAALAGSLRACGLEVTAEEIHSALEATVAAAAERCPRGRCLVVGEEGMAEAAAAAGLAVVADAPADVVIVGLTRFGDYRLLSAAARCLLGGAELLGCHRNKLWLDDDGFGISCGPYLAALEHATGARAEIFGKPTAAFYDQVRVPLAVEPRQAVMVGDDLTADVHGAQQAGLRAVLVLSGKTSRRDVAGSEVKPDLIIDEVDDLVDLLPA